MFPLAHLKITTTALAVNAEPQKGRGKAYSRAQLSYQASQTEGPGPS